MNEKLTDLLPNLNFIQNPEDINESTRLEEDLGMYGYQARSFMFKYSETFNVDISQFRFTKYFSPDTFYNQLYKRYFKRRKNILTLGDLDQAIAYGRINEKVLAAIREKNTEKVPHKKLYKKTSFRFTRKEVIFYLALGIVTSIILGLVAYFS